MSNYPLVAGALAVLVGLVHSLLGEWMVFRRIRGPRLYDGDGRLVLGRPHLAILRVTWHVASIFGWGLAALLLWVGLGGEAEGFFPMLRRTAVWTFLAAGLLTLFGTRSRHPGWVALLMVAALLALS